MQFYIWGMYRRVLTIQDISCFGQCSLTVALPIISACGVETAVLPSAILSTHTGGFTGWTFQDLTKEMLPISEHWRVADIRFDAFYTGYLGSIEQINMVQHIMDTNGVDGAIRVVDPAMADNGALYPGFNMEFVAAMKDLCAHADVLLPNMTEACMLTDTEYSENIDRETVELLCKKLCELGTKSVVLTGVGFRAGYTGVMLYDGKDFNYYEHKKITKGFNGTGDCYASAFVGAMLRGRPMVDAARIAADFVLECIEKTYEDKSHWYGVKFELALPNLIKNLADE